ncbi:MAG: hypothetical protein A2Y20_08055 [Firmicutes bacterium GWF2_51_9]|nr:hypothetical protein [Erysipelotrichaceae bacterium]OGS54654.1 MAG: hypothetical protein A2Y20_08055 [Firmicutes bacterium GWF2_51_9]OGS58661.1 MAG: hypothetical protein A2Y19_03790 [Firmicutes bacterium GWE2_51_13]HAM63638.1 hypothetical protein [Erysipelotrichaceae bacterium]HAO60578.1 hypothetical protein [Erysipelotrichaceae bacterium]
MGWMRESFGINVREEVKTWTRCILEQGQSITTIQLSGAGIKNENGETISSEGFRLKQSEIHYIKNRILRSDVSRWKCETRIVEGDNENFGKVEVLTKIKPR